MQLYEKKILVNFFLIWFYNYGLLYNILYYNIIFKNLIMKLIKVAVV